MKSKSLKLLIAVILIMQTITFTPVFANEDATVFYDYSGSKHYDMIGNVVEGVADNSIVYGQFGKAKDDASLRLYTAGGDIPTKNQWIRYNPALTLAANEYLHISFDYLRENYHSAFLMDMSFKCASDGSLRYDKTVSDYNVNHANWYNQVRVFPNNGQSGLPDSLGTWCKYDAYFSTSSGQAVIFVNGKKYENDLSKQSAWTAEGAYTGIRYIDRIRIFHLSDKATNTTPSAVQFDNFLVESVKSIPNAVEYKKLGETLNFDDNASISTHRDGYGLYNTTYYNGSSNMSVTRYNGYSDPGPSVYLGMPVEGLSVDGGVFGKPVWDKSFHRIVPLDADVDKTRSTWYRSSVNDICSGEIAHLTFNVANNVSDIPLSVYNENRTYGDGSVETNRVELFKMDTNGKIKFLGADTDVGWEIQKWYKVDILFNVNESSTVVDCFVNGINVIDNFEWTEKALKYLNQVHFSSALGSDYYLDDISYGRFTNSGVHNPEVGYSITDTAETFIDNKEKIIAIESDCSVGDFVNLLAEKNNVTVYNENGVVISKGTINSKSVVKVSNGFGAGTYYNVGYKTDKLAIGDITYDSAAQQLKSQAEIGFGIKENYNDADVPVQTSGTIIIALYEGNELVDCMHYSYTDLVEDAAKEVTLSNVESVQGKTVKVFIFNSEDDITPLVINKVKSDF